MKNLVFDKWDMSEVKLTDVGLQRYVNLEPKLVFHSHGRLAGKVLGKGQLSIVERLINTLMRSGTGRKVGGKQIHGRFGCGKKNRAYKIVEDAFVIINQKTKSNPIQILAQAIENSAPREETTRVKFGGITRHIAVDISPQRRVDFALRNIGISVVAKSFDNPKSAEEALADELIAASKNDASSLAVAKKNEIERVAKGAR